MKLDIADLPKFELFQENDAWGVRDGSVTIFQLSEVRARLIAAGPLMLRFLHPCYRKGGPLGADLDTLFARCGLEMDYRA